MDTEAPEGHGGVQWAVRFPKDPGDRSQSPESPSWGSRMGRVLGGEGQPAVKVALSSASAASTSSLEIPSR
ncbi:hypothetical protein HD596_003141 [Nonomuraea jabiensis]|uniref:Uncharacterized protein n=1 Tax=Nonomuraea jabiensis TaxID=882448 RepID=A0A7W9G373_9ACTN|nr:hypothetical protein [Nonomuraea jabiensis]